MTEFTGINIQWPISQDILSGKKTIETRTYKLPDHYLNVDMAMVETPGPKGRFKARIVAIIRFTSCFPYKNKKEFYEDYDRHLVDKNSDWAWKDKPKWGWKLEIVSNIKPSVLCKQRGIIYRPGIHLDL